ncbi:MAG TPA: proton-conducting transporter membrane subunit, partial [Thermoguttaceae bacterium]|nr:proton-conducting transporter membrane subunit [Thermoguttaceae bacterium]
SHPAIAASLAVCLLSLTGVPPLAGFWGKLVVLAGALEVDPAASGVGVTRFWLIALAVLGVLNAAVGAAYYLRVIAVIYFRLPLAELRAEGGRACRAVALVCALAVVGIGLASGPLWNASRDAARSVTTAQGPSHGSTTHQDGRTGPSVQLVGSADLRPGR